MTLSKGVSVLLRSRDLWLFECAGVVQYLEDSHGKWLVIASNRDVANAAEDMMTKSKGGKHKVMGSLIGSIHGETLEKQFAAAIATGTDGVLLLCADRTWRLRWFDDETD